MFPVMSTVLRDIGLSSLDRLPDLQSTSPGSSIPTALEGRGRKSFCFVLLEGLALLRFLARAGVPQMQGHIARQQDSWFSH